jgi:predicted nucleic acid-binding Zn ribbon protein
VSREHDRPVEPGRRRRGRSPGKEEISREGANAGDRSADGPTGGGRDLAPRGMERLADLLPRAAREYGLEALAWDRIVADRVPAAAGACRLTDLRQGVATIEIDLPIVAQEIRLRSPELLAALRAAVRTPIRQIRLTTRHV